MMLQTDRSHRCRWVQGQTLVLWLLPERTRGSWSPLVPQHSFSNPGLKPTLPLRNGPQSLSVHLPQEQGVPKELFGRSAAWSHSDFGSFLQFPSQTQNLLVQSPSHCVATAAHCWVKLLQLRSLGSPPGCPRARSVPVGT